MLFLPIIHIGLLLLLPIGTLLIIFNKKQNIKIIGIALIIVSIPFYYFCYYIFPFDFIIPRQEVKLTINISNSKYKVEISQKPTCFEYYTYGNIIRKDNETYFFLCDVDDYKWWKPITRKIDNKIYFLRGSHKIDTYTPWVDIKTLDVYTGGVTRNTININELQFE